MQNPIVYHVTSSSNPFLISNSLINQSNGEPNWFYKDPQGVKRGPFSSLEMQTWYEAGYFTDEIPIALGANTMFMPLKSFKEMSNHSAVLDGK